MTFDRCISPSQMANIILSASSDVASMRLCNSSDSSEKRFNSMYKVLRKLQIVGILLLSSNIHLNDIKMEISQQFFNGLLSISLHTSKNYEAGAGANCLVYTCAVLVCCEPLLIEDIDFICARILASIRIYCAK